MLTAWTGPSCKQEVIPVSVRASIPDSTGAAKQLTRELLRKLLCGARAVRNVSTDWYRHRFLLTARSGPGCKHELVPLPVRAHRQFPFRKRRGRIRTEQNRTTPSLGEPENNQTKKRCSTIERFLAYLMIVVSCASFPFLSSFVFLIDAHFYLQSGRSTGVLFSILPQRQQRLFTFCQLPFFSLFFMTSKSE